MELPVEWLRWAGVAIALALLGMSLYIIKDASLGRHASLSLHAASRKSHYLTLGLFLTFGGALFYSFIAWWIVPTYALDPSVNILLGLAFIAQLGMAWVPASTRNKRFSQLHLFFGTLVASAMVLFLGLLSLNAASLPWLSGLLIPLGTLATLIMLALYAFVRPMRAHFLIYEMLFIAFFCVAMILLAFKV